MAVVGLTYNLGKDEPPADGEPPDGQAEFDGETTIFAIREALRSANHQVELIEANEYAFPALLESRPDVVFNISEGLRGESRESQIPAFLEMLGIPYTGSKVMTLAICLDKPTTKKILSYHGIPTPRFHIIGLDDSISTDLKYPVFVKPSHEGSSMGISPKSVVYNDTDFARQVDYLRDAYKQPVLVEEYLSGREFTVSILGNRKPVFLPIIEINFEPCSPDHGKVYSRVFKAEWSDDSYYLCPAPLREEQEQEILRCALAAYRALGCLDVARIDIRMNDDGVPHVLEVNPLPGLKPGFSDLPRAAEAGGISYSDLINGILNCALYRYGLAHLVPGAGLNRLRVPA